MRKQWKMLWCLSGLVSLCWVGGGTAMGQERIGFPQYPQYVQYPPGAPPVIPAVPAAEVTLTPEQVDQLLAPIALYPDPLLSMMFPAATYPQDIVAAAQWLQATPNPTEADIAAQGWDESIKGLVHYPSVLKMMSDQIDWTQALGASFASRQQDVLDSVQRLRARAQAAQNLQSTPQEQVLVDNSAIRIEPADPNVIYVPQYDPDVVYASAYPLSFGIGYPLGLWCDNDFDWNNGYIVNGGGWYSGWHHPGEWDRRRPVWDHHPAGWAAAPKRWERAASRPAPRLTTAAVNHLSLGRLRGTPAVNAVPGTTRKAAASLAFGRQPAPAPSRNVFGSTESRADVQRALQRTRPTLAQPTATVIPPATVRLQPSPRPTVATPAPRPIAVMPTPRPIVAAPAPRVASAPSPRPSAPPALVAPRAAPSNVFSGGSAAATRAQSSRGNASRHR